MADVLLIYAASDRDKAGSVAAALEARGYSVSWDLEYLTPRKDRKQRNEIYDESYYDLQAQQLRAAKKVVVLLSDATVPSYELYTLAREALSHRKLVPVLIAPVGEVPKPFARLQRADLIGWRDDPWDPRFDLFTAAIEVGPVLDRTLSTSAPYPGSFALPRLPELPLRRIADAALWIVAGALVLAAIGVVGAAVDWRRAIISPLDAVRSASLTLAVLLLGSALAISTFRFVTALMIGIRIVRLIKLDDRQESRPSSDSGSGTVTA